MKFFFSRKSFVIFFPNFKLEIGFFSEFAKKVANVPQLTKFIYSDLHLSQFSAKSEKLFFQKKIPIFRKFCEFFLIFLKKSQIFQNSANLFVMKFKCAKFQIKKNSQNIPKKFRKFRFFSKFLKKISNVPKFRKFICTEI